MCYYCETGACLPQILLNHILENHEHDKNRVSFRVRKISPDTGCWYYQSVHFPVSLVEIKDRLAQGFKPFLDVTNNTIRFKRSFDEHEVHVTHEKQNEPSDSKSSNILEDVLNVMASIGREDDFLSILHSLVSGELSPDNIALHLLLDVGQFLRQPKVNCMRYSNVSKDFWLIVMKMFKGRGLRFFRGFMGEGLKDKVLEGK